MPFRSKKSARFGGPPEALTQLGKGRMRETVAQWQNAGEAKKDVDFFLDFMKSLDLVAMRNGDILDHHKESVSPNQIKTMLRRAYIEENRSLTGKALGNLVNIFMRDVSLSISIMLKRVDKAEIPLAELLDDPEF